MPPRKKLDLNDCIERVVDMFNNKKMSCRDISEALKNDGIEVSHSTVARTVKSHNEDLEEWREKIRQEKAMLDVWREENATDGTAGLDFSEACINKLRPYITKAIEAMGDDEKHFKDAKELVNSLESLTRSQVAITKARYTHERVFADAKKIIEQEFAEHLQNEHPELLLRILDVLDNVRHDNERLPSK